MPQYTVRAGVDTFFVFGTETTYGVAASSLNNTLGIVQSFNPNISRSLQRIRGIDGVLPASNTVSTARDAKGILSGTVAATLSIGFQPQNFSWLEFVMGSKSGLGTAASKFNYPQATASTDADKQKYIRLPSLTFGTNYRFGGSADNANVKWNLLGAKINSCTISGSIGDPISVSVEMPFADLVPNGTLDAPVALPAEDVFHFTDFAIEIPTGSVFNNLVDSFEVSIQNGVEMLYGLGSVIAKDAKELSRDFSLSITANKEGRQFIDSIKGDASTTEKNTLLINSIKITLTKTATKTLTIHLLRLRLDSNNEQGDHPAVKKESLSLIPEVVYFEEQTAA